MPELNSTRKQSILSVPVSELVPHSDPMVLIDQVIDFETDKLSAQFTIQPNSRFYDDSIEGVDNVVAIEYMAQSIAALAGVRSRLKQEAVKLGFLLGTRKMELHRACFSLGETYQVEVEELYMDDSGLGSFHCSISGEGHHVAEAKLSVFETNDQNQLLN